MFFKRIFVVFFYSVITLNSWSYTFFSLNDGQEISESEFANRIDRDAIILMGEYHYVKSYIKAQAHLINKMGQLKNSRGKVSVAWEFLLRPEQPLLEKNFLQYKNGSQSFRSFIEVFFPNPDQDKENAHLVYKPVFDAAVNMNAEFVATNAPRAWKRVVRTQGVDKLPIEQVPAGMRRGVDEYFERFLAAIGGHGDPALLEGYFMAQSYTDAFIAEALVSQTNGHLTFMTVGTFHNDYGHGLPFYLNNLSSRQVVNVKLVGREAHIEEEIEEMKQLHPKYGAIADYLLIFD